MSEPSFREIQANGIRMRVAEQGAGPLVLFCHGWPESWYSWRHQLKALAAAGYRAVAPDMRGYGGSEAPAEIEKYTLLHLVGDMVELVKALGESQAVIVGHDWGAPVAWNSAMLRPDMFRAVVGMSVPYSPPAHVDFLSALAKRGINTFYMQYFQEPGVAEAEFERDIEATLRRVYFSGSGDAPERSSFGLLAPGKGFLDNTIDPETLPSWMNRDDIAYYAGEFRRAGFRGGLNWYRNLRRSWELFGPWRGCVVNQPSMFIAGARDGVLKFPASKAQIESFPSTLPGIRGCHILDGAGHWIQRERTAAVNELLLGFLRTL
ncbi:MAG: alpha/beta hydrolase [Betaproteobacteria bacterium]|nr:alpha/beta hydrolase [Betaproteobacteria bacterium]